MSQNPANKQSVSNLKETEGDSKSPKLQDDDSVSQFTNNKDIDSVSKSTNLHGADGVVNVPIDNGNIVYWSCCILGISMLLPMNFYFNADGYWKYKWRNIDNDTETGAQSELQKFWGSNISVVSMAPNFVFLFINVLFGHKVRTQPRIYFALLLNILLFILSTIFTRVNTDPWQTGFYGLTLSFALLFNISDSIFQGAFTSSIGRFPPRYMGCLMQGQAIGGIMSSGLSVLLLAIGGDSVSVALFYFLFAAVFLAFSLGLFFFISRQNFYRFYSSQSVEAEKEDKHTDVDLKFVLKHTAIPGLSVFLVYFVTMGVYPTLHIAAETTIDDETWAKFFLPVGAFLMYNCLDFSGRFLAATFKWPRPNRRGAIICLVITISRLAFIPLLISCNIRPNDRHLTKVYFKSDFAFLAIHAVFSLSNGYMTNINMMNGPAMVKGENNQAVAASIMIFMLVFGLFIGACFSYLWVMLL